METQRIDRKRKLDHEQDSAATAVGLSLCEMFDQRFAEKTEGWEVLHPILENDVLQAKIPSSDAALAHLVRWFRTIARDADKLRLFRQWVIPRCVCASYCRASYHHAIAYTTQLRHCKTRTRG